MSVFFGSILIEIHFNPLFSDSCAKTGSRASTNFFALSAKAFKTEVKGQQDGYTILWLPDQSTGQQTLKDPQKSKKRKHMDRHRKDFVVWEIHST